MARSILLVSLLMAMASGASGSETWVVLGLAKGATVECNPVYTWRAVAIAHNLDDDYEAEVRVVHFSDGVIGPSDSLVLPPAQSAIIPPLYGVQASVPIYVAHIAAPDGVAIEGRLEYLYDSPCSAAPPLPGPAGKIAFPVFRRLADAGERQVHLGSDLGLQNARVNVGIYNAGKIEAHAVIRIHRPACGGDGIAMTEVRVRPDSLLQSTVQQPPTCGGLGGAVPAYVTYASVIVDQPSLSYVTPVSNVQAPTISFGVAAPNP